MTDVLSKDRMPGLHVPRRHIFKAANTALSQNTRQPRTSPTTRDSDHPAQRIPSQVGHRWETCALTPGARLSASPVEEAPMKQPPGLVVRLGDVFRSEIKTIRGLGCRLELKTEDGVLGSTIYARITPVAPQAVRAMRDAATQNGAPGRQAIEVRQAFDRPEDLLDASRTAIGQALDITRAALS